MNVKSIVDDYFDTVSADEVVEIIDEIKTHMLRGPCDNYCPLISHICCGLPDASDIYKAAKKGLVWACHSNNKFPCVSTDLNEFPQGCIVITDPNEFIRLTGYLC